MKKIQLHIVSFDIPFPPNYGGVIDVFYKIKALSEVGIAIHLHCFEYGRKRSEEELKKFCRSVTYYRRYKSPGNLLSSQPFIVKTRAHDDLLKNLLKNDYPILFEGLHTTAFLNHEKLNRRVKLVRVHNVEHDYYHNLAKAETNPFRKWFFNTEANKLRHFEAVLKHADKILTISQNDQVYFSTRYENAVLIHPFHPFEKLNIGGSRNYAFYHGNLGVNENRQALEYLINDVFSKIDVPLVVAGKDARRAYAAIGAILKNVKVVTNPGFDEMNEWAKNASVHVLPTFQSTGFKLKLLYALFTAPAVVVNREMVAGTGLEKFCVVANTTGEMIKEIKRLHHTTPSKEELQNRAQFLNNKYSNHENALTIKSLLKTI